VVDYLKSYEELLKDARKGLPDKTLSKERFEPPRANISIQGTKTIIANFDAVCQKLRREPKMVSKYLGKELAVPVSIEGSRLVLHGKISERQVNERLSNYIKYFVMCKECNRPDTKIISGEHGFSFLVCEACGARSPVK